MVILLRISGNFSLVRRVQILREEAQSSMPRRRQGSSQLRMSPILSVESKSLTRACTDLIQLRFYFLISKDLENKVVSLFMMNRKVLESPLMKQTRNM